MARAKAPKVASKVFRAAPEGWECQVCVDGCVVCEGWLWDPATRNEAVKAAGRIANTFRAYSAHGAKK